MPSRAPNHRPERALERLAPAVLGPGAQEPATREGGLTVAAPSEARCRASAGRQGSAPCLEVSPKAGQGAAVCPDGRRQGPLRPEGPSGISHLVGPTTTALGLQGCAVSSTEAGTTVILSATAVEAPSRIAGQARFTSQADNPFRDGGGVVALDDERGPREEGRCDI